MLDRYTTKLVKAVFVLQLLHTSQVQPVLIAILLLTGILLPNHVKHAIYKTINITVLIKCLFCMSFFRSYFAWTGLL